MTFAAMVFKVVTLFAIAIAAYWTASIAGQFEPAPTGFEDCASKLRACFFAVV